MTASVGFWIVGSSRSSTRTSPGACRTAPRMVGVPFGVGGSVDGLLDDYPGGERRSGGVVPRACQFGAHGEGVGDPGERGAADGDQPERDGAGSAEPDERSGQAPEREP